MKMKRLTLILGCVLTLGLSACGKEVADESDYQELIDENLIEDTVTVENGGDEEADIPVVNETKEGYYKSELTGEWLDQSLTGQRPIAVMIDNERTALPHYGTSQADILYEMTNSTMNDGITRFMAIFKDYDNVKQIGSIRSVRTTNLQIAPEYNAIVCHDGGPYYIDRFLSNPYVEHLSGGFSRVNNGKAREFTEYIMAGEIPKRLAANDINPEYNEYYEKQPHFKFCLTTETVDLSGASDAKDATVVDLPFDHNSSMLEYNAETGKYRYSEYGKEYTDALTGDHLEFTNVIVQEAKLDQLDDHGYMHFYVTENAGMHGWYLTGGKAIPVTWEKKGDTVATRYYNSDGEEITVNIGKTYIAIVRSSDWDRLDIH